LFNAFLQVKTITRFVSKQKDRAPYNAFEHRGSEAIWGFKQNLQSFGFSSPNFYCQKEKKYYDDVTHVTDTMDEIACLNNRISPVLSRN